MGVVRERPEATKQNDNKTTNERRRLMSKQYNINNVKGEIIKALAKRLEKDAVRGKWAAYWGKAAALGIAGLDHGNKD